MIDATFLFDRALPALNDGFVLSIQLIVPSAILGFAGGVLVGTARAFGPPWLKRLGNAFTALIRGVPLVVQLFFLYYALPKVGISLSPYAAALLGFIMCSSAYNSEYIRGALLSIRQGQIKAAQALGFSTRQLLASVVIPQAVRRALPGCGNEVIYLIKYSSLAYLVTCMELTGKAKSLASQTYNVTEVFMIAGAYYLAMTTLAAWGLSKLEKLAYIPGFGRQR